MALGFGDTRPLIHTAAFDVAEVHFDACLIEYRPPDEALLPRTRKRKRAPPTKKGFPDVSPVSGTTPGTKKGKRKRDAGESACEPPTKKARVTEKPKEQTIEQLFSRHNAEEQDEDVVFVPRFVPLQVVTVDDEPPVLSSPPVEEKMDVDAPVLRPEHVRIVSAWQMDLRLPAEGAVTMEFERGQLPRVRPQAVVRAEEVRGDDDTSDRNAIGCYETLADQVATWDALYTVVPRPGVYVEAQVDHLQGKRDWFKGPKMFALSKIPLTTVRVADRLRGIGAGTRQRGHAAKKAGVPRGVKDYAERKRLSVVALMQSLRDNGDTEGLNLVATMRRAGWKIDDFADAYGMAKAKAQEAFGVKMPDVTDVKEAGGAS